MKLLQSTRGGHSLSTCSVSGPPTTEPAAAWRPLPGLVHGQRSTANFPPVQRSDGCLGIRLVPHLDERESPGAPRLPVRDHLHLDDFAPIFLEERAQLRFVHVKRQIPHI
jgi:hypothetical protein